MSCVICVIRVIDWSEEKNNCFQIIELGFGGSEADLFLRKAHGWGFQGYWRNEKEDETPDPEKAREKLVNVQSCCGRQRSNI